MNNKTQWLGCSNPEFVLYLEKPPVLSLSTLEDTTRVSSTELITLNGNNWRKILTIFAKLVTPEGVPWQAYRDQQLLQTHAIAFSTQVQPFGKAIVAGKVSWQRLGFAPKADDALDDQGKLFVLGDALLTPYFDYRQFPNELVAQARHWLKRSTVMTPLDTE